ncbi:inositol oxygenase [Umbelopsis sp. AD052]|nr:inositol oxygenase [Umbelopsis sp. AD052]
MRIVNNLSEAAKVSEAWEEFLKTKYGANKSSKQTAAFRDYEVAMEEQPTVAKFYKENHEKQTLQHVLEKKANYTKLDKTRMGIWEAMEKLNELVDESDPDTSLSQIAHLLQSAEAARRDGQPRWMILTCLIHDLGKYLFFLGEPQWTVVGDTFPVGCQYSDEIVYPNYFAGNPDIHNSKLTTKYGIYSPNCGLDNVHMSFGHDEYLYHVCKPYLPTQALFIIRYHSFYSCHTNGAYDWLMNNEDVEHMKWVKTFNQYDLYSKADEEPNVEELKPFYQELIAEYFPDAIAW